MTFHLLLLRPVLKEKIDSSLTHLISLETMENDQDQLFPTSNKLAMVNSVVDSTPEVDFLHHQYLLYSFINMEKT